MKKKKTKQILAVFLTLSLSITMTPVAGLFAYGEQTESGSTASESKQSEVEQTESGSTASEPKQPEAEVQKDKATQPAQSDKAPANTGASKGVATAKGGITPFGAGDLTAEIRDDSGNWISLAGATDVAAISYQGNASKTYNLRLIVDVPASAANVKLTVTMPEGMAYVDNGTGNGAVLAWINNPATDIVKTANPAVYGYNNTATGKIEFNFKPGTVTVTVPMVIQADNAYVFEQITNAIKAQLSYTVGGTSESETQTLEILNISGVPKGCSWYYTSGVSVNHVAVTDQVEQLDYFARRILPTSFGAGGASVLIEEFSTILTVSNPNAIITCTDAGWTMTNLGGGQYKFSRKNFRSSYIDVPWAIEFPSGSFSEGDIVTVTTSNTTLSYYGPISVQPPGEQPHTFTIAADKEDVYVGFITLGNANAALPATNAIVSNYATWGASTEAVSVLGWVGAGNRGAVTSAAKICEMHFDSTDIGVMALNIPIPYGVTVTSIEYTSKSTSGWTSVPMSLTATSATNTCAYISYMDLGIARDDYITGIKYNMGAIPGATQLGMVNATTNRLYLYGVILTEGKTVNNTIEIYNASSGPVTTGKGTARVVTSKTQGGLGFYNLKASATYTAGDTVKISGDLNPGSTSFNGITENPILYIRSETGLPISNLKVVNGMGVDITSRLEVTTFDDTAGVLTYKVDTKNITNGDAIVSYSGGSYVSKDTGGLTARWLTFSYDIKTDKATKGGTYQFSDMLFAENPNDVAIISSSTLNKVGSSYTPNDYDPYKLNQDGHGAVAGIVASATNFYAIKGINDIIVTNALKHQNGPTWLTWDGTPEGYIQVGIVGNFTFRTTITNRAGVAAPAGTVVYQPIPKAGDNWKDLGYSIDGAGSEEDALLFSANLIGPIANPDPSMYKITYGIVTPTDDYDQLNAANAGGNFVTEGNVLDWSQINCIRIESIDAIPDDIRSNFDAILTVDPSQSSAEGTVDIIKPIFYRNLTTAQGDPYAGVVKGDFIALQLGLGAIRGIIWDDVNHDGMKDAGEPVFGGTDWTVNLYRTDDSTKTVIQSVHPDGTGQYTFPDLLREAGYYSIEVNNAKTAQNYIFTKVNSATDNQFVGNAAQTIGTASSLTAVLVPGTPDLPGGSTGIYHIGLTNVETIITFITKTGDNTQGTFTFDAVSGLTNKATSGTPSDSLETPTVQAASGYQFIGWSTKTNADINTPADFVTIPSVYGYDDITYYAYFKGDPYTVTYLGNGSTSGSMEDEIATYGSNFTLATNAYVKTGYIFDGWNTQADGEGTAYTAGYTFSPWNLTSNLTLYAQWIPDTKTPYVVEHYRQDLGAATYTKVAADTENKTGTTGGTATFTPKSYPGFTYQAGETTYQDSINAASTTVRTIAANGSLIIKLYYNRDAYTVTYAPGTKGAFTDDVHNNVQYEAATPPFDVTKTIGGKPAGMTGYNFTNWNPTVDATVSGTVTYTAQWAANTHKIIFDPNTGSGTMADLPIDFDQTKKLTANAFTKTGWSFIGWNTDPKATSGQYADESNYTLTVDADVTLYAIWVPKNYGLSFNANGGEGNMDPVSIGYDETITLPENTFTRQGHTFLGWAMDFEAQTPDYPDQADYTHETEGNVTLYALWEINDYTVYFDTNGGSPTTIGPIKVNYGENIMSQPTFPADPTKAKDGKFIYTFKGWEVVKLEAPASKSKLQAVTDSKKTGTKAIGTKSLIPTELLTSADLMPAADVYLQAKWNTKRVDPEEPNLSVVKKADQKTVKPGSNISYTITVKNTGKTTATDIELKDVLPKYTTYVSSTHGGKYYASGNYVLWKIDSLAPGKSISVNLVLKTDKSVPKGYEFKNVIHYGTGGDMNSTSNTAVTKPAGKGVQTGDDSNMLLYGVIAAIAALLAMIAAFPTLRRKWRRN